MVIHVNYDVWHAVSPGRDHHHSISQLHGCVANSTRERCDYLSFSILNHAAIQPFFIIYAAQINKVTNTGSMT